MTISGEAILIKLPVWLVYCQENTKLPIGFYSLRNVPSGPVGVLGYFLGGSDNHTTCWALARHVILRLTKDAVNIGAKNMT